MRECDRSKINLQIKYEDYWNKRHTKERAVVFPVDVPED